MLLKRVYFFRILRTLHRLTYGVYIGTFFLFSYFLFSFLISDPFSCFFDLTNPKEQVIVTKEPIERIKGFSLKQDPDGFLYEEIEQSLQFAAINLRPDAVGEPCASIFFKEQDAQFIIKQGETLYLDFLEESLCFSKEQTPISIFIQGFDHQKLECLVSVNSGQDQEGSATISIKSSLSKTDLSSFYTLFKSLTALKKDLIFDLYEEDKLKQRDLVRIFDGSKSPYAVFVKEGDFLMYKDHRWDVATEQSSFYPLMEVEKVNQDCIKVKIWNQSGTLFTTKDLSFAASSEIPTQESDLFKKISPRGHDVVLCKIGKQNSLLKKGDWLIKTRAYWKSVKTLDEMQRCLNLQTPAELFVFEGIEKKEGRAFFKGTLFDKMRVEKKRIEVPIHLFEKPSLKSKKRLNDLSKNNIDQIRQTSETNSDVQEELLKLTTPTKRHEFSK